MIILPQDIGPGERVAAGFSQGLESLAQYKLDQMQKAKTAKGLQAIGIPEQQATMISHMDPKIINEFVKRALDAPAQQAFSRALNQVLGGSAQPQPMQSMTANMPIGLAYPTQTAGLLQGLPQSGQMQPGQTGQTLPIPGIASALGAQGQPQEPQIDLTGVKPQQAMGLAQLFQGRQQMASQEKIAERRLEGQMSRQEKAQAFEEQQDVDKTLTPYVTKLRDEAEGAREGRAKYQRMEKLIKNGELGERSARSFVHTLKRGVGGEYGVGIDLSFMLAPGTHEFEKLSASFINGLQKTFGAKITNADLSAFMATIPNLSQSDEGILRIIHYNDKLNELREVRHKAGEDIIKENKGHYPRDLQNQIYGKTADKEQQIYDEIITGLSKEKIADKLPDYGEKYQQKQSAKTAPPPFIGGSGISKIADLLFDRRR
jgi:hypothetical protein